MRVIECVITIGFFKNFNLKKYIFNINTLKQYKNIKKI
jgi:hypothetical protein